MTANTSDRKTQKQRIPLLDVCEGIAKDLELSVFLVIPETGLVTHASPVCLEEFSKMGFPGESVILGRPFTEIYDKSAVFLFTDDEDRKDFVLQQKQAWERVRQTDNHMTSHLISRENGGRRVVIRFRRLVNNWDQVVAYTVEIRMQRLTAEQCREEIEQGRVFVPAPLKQVA